MNKFLFSSLTFANNFFIKRNNKVSLWGRRMVNDNIEQILSYMIDNGYNEKYKIICHFKYKDSFKKYAVKNVKIISNPFLSVYHMFTSRVIIHAIGLSYMAFKSCRNQIIFDTLHGNNYIDKKNNNKNEDYLKAIDDMTLVSSEHLEKIIHYLYGLDYDKFVVGGNPRNDLLYSTRSIKKMMNLEAYSKIILYMPTYRQSDLNGYDSSSIFPLITFDNIDAINSKLSEYNILMIIKPHPLQNHIALFNEKKSNILCVTTDELRSNDIKLYELVGQSDALITDISSISVDYMALNKPIGYVVDDLEDYKKGRGIIALKDDGTIDENPEEIDLPGLKIKAIDDLFRFFDDLANGIDEYSEARNEKKVLCNKYCDNKNTERVLKFVGIVR